MKHTNIKFWNGFNYSLIQGLDQDIITIDQVKKLLKLNDLTIEDLLEVLDKESIKGIPNNYFYRKAYEILEADLETIY